MNKLFVSGFPLEISELELAQLIAPHGDIETIKIVRDRKTRICKGYAFVEMRTEEGVMKVIEALDGALMGDRNLTINPVAEKAETQVLKKPAPGRGRPFTAGGSYRSKTAGRPKRPRKVM